MSNNKNLKKILLTVAYDGTNYYGFQKQAIESQPTVEKELERALKAFFKQEVNCIGASRTDRGVHSLGQRVTIDVETTVPPEKLPFALKSFLPEDIAIMEGVEVENNFHPRYDCVCKIYEYKIYNNKYKNPLYRNFSEFVYTKLDIIAMKEASKHLIGKHDFKAFCAAGSSAKTTVRTIFDIDVFENGDFIIIRVCGDGFLYNMVRIIAGTLIMVGEGRKEPYEVLEALKSLDRAKAGKTAGPNGLTLMKINYK